MMTLLYMMLYIAQGQSESLRESYIDQSKYGQSCRAKFLSSG